MALGDRLILVLGALLAASPAPAAAEVQRPELDFDRYEVSTGDAERQTVLTGFFLGRAAAEIAVVSADADGGRRVRMFGFDDGALVPVVEAKLRPRVLFVDVARVGDRDRLITYEHGRLGWLDPEAATDRPLLELAARYRAAAGDGVPRVDITRDLDRDGRDDLVMPDLDGFWIATQRRDGSFADAVKLGPPEPLRDEVVGRLDSGGGPADAARTYGEVGITAMTVPVYLGRLHQMDYDRDGRVDLVFWSEDHFEAHLQDEDGLFDPVATSFTTDVPFDSEGAYSHAFEFRDSGMMRFIFGIGEMTRRTVLHSLRDLDGDGVGDLVTLTLSGRSITRLRSVYEVHFGEPVPGGTLFARQAGAVIRPRGRAGGMEPWGYSARRFEDFDGDGKVDILFSDVRVGIGGMMRALVGNTVPIDLELYRAGDRGYPDALSVRRRIRRFAPFAGIGNVFFPPVLMGDVNGDGRSDLLVGRSPEKLHVFLGVPGPELLAPRPEKVAVSLPPDESKSWLADLDRDGKQDLLVFHTPTARQPSRPYSLTVLVAR